MGYLLPEEIVKKVQKDDIQKEVIAGFVLDSGSWIPVSETPFVVLSMKSRVYQGHKPQDR